jgi:hypothetical protein
LTMNLDIGLRKIGDGLYGETCCTICKKVHWLQDVFHLNSQDLPKKWRCEPQWYAI